MHKIALILPAFFLILIITFFAPAYASEDVEVEGTLKSAHADDFEGKKSREEYFIETDDEKTYTLKFDSKPRDLKIGSKVKVKGKKSENSISLSPSLDSTALVTTSSVQASSITTARVAVILFKFQNTVSVDGSRTVANTRSIMFDSPESVKNYYQENSYSKLSFSGDVFGTYTIPVNEPGPSDPCWTNELNSWGAAASQAAQNSGVTLGSYSHFVFVMPRHIQACQFGGYAEGQGTKTYINDAYPAVYTHELGHNFGVHHASTYSCGAKAIDVASNCTLNEYGDQSDVMSNISQLYHFNGAHKVESGWASGVQVLNITSGGRYTINKLETGPDPQVLKIHKNDTNEDYYLSYRRPLGFDAPLGEAAITNGVSIQVWSGNYEPAKFIDTKPESPGYFADAPLLDGSTFTDQLNNITVTQVSHNLDSVTVDITIPQLPPPPPPPPGPEAGDLGLRADFNGDNKNDLAFFRPSNGSWYLPGQNPIPYGRSTDVPVPADYNGDGKSDIAVWQSNGDGTRSWFIKDQFSVPWGKDGDIPVPGDYNGDGRADIAVWRPSDGVWYVKDIFSISWGRNGDVPVAEDYNGDNKIDIAVWQSNGDGTRTWYIKDIAAIPWGKDGDITVPANYNGDNKAEVAVWRPSDGIWYIKDVGNTPYGRDNEGYSPLQADYNGDGRADIAHFKAIEGKWYVNGIGVLP